MTVKCDLFLLVGIIVVTDMLLFRCSWFSMSITDINATEIFFHFSCALGHIIQIVILKANSLSVIHVLRDEQNMCAVTKGGTILKISTCSRFLTIAEFEPLKKFSVSFPFTV